MYHYLYLVIFSILWHGIFSAIIQAFHFLDFSGVHIWILGAIWKWVMPPVHQLSALFDGFPVWLVWLEPALLFAAPQWNGGVHCRYWHVISSWLIFSCLYFIHSIGMYRMRWFLAVLRSFFHSSLVCTFSCHPSPPTILPNSLTSSCHLFLGLTLDLVFPKFMYNTLLGILFSSFLCTCPNQRNLACMQFSKSSS